MRIRYIDISNAVYVQHACSVTMLTNYWTLNDDSDEKFISGLMPVMILMRRISCSLTTSNGVADICQWILVRLLVIVWSHSKKFTLCNFPNCSTNPIYSSTHIFVPRRIRPIATIIEWLNVFSVCLRNCMFGWLVAIHSNNGSSKQWQQKHTYH